jgi:hypothetical protein
MNRLFDFFFTNERLRWKVYGVSAGVAFVYVLFNLWGLHRSEQQVFSEIIWILPSTILLSATVYVLKGPALRSQGVRPGYGPGDAALTIDRNYFAKCRPRFQQGLIITGAIATVFLTTMLEIDVSSFQASVANHALNATIARFGTVYAATWSPEQVQANVRKIQAIVTTASTDKIPINPDTLNKAQATLSGYVKKYALPQQTKQAVYAVTIDLQSLAYTRELQNEAITPRQLAKEGYPIASTVVLNHDLYVKGEHSKFFLTGGSFYVKHCTVVFDGIDFESPYDVYPLAVGEGGNILVRDSIFQGGSQLIDKITWVNVEFRKTMLGYSGGPIRLRNVSFRDYGDEATGPSNILLYASLPIELTNMILKANGQPINYVYEPPASR